MGMRYIAVQLHTLSDRLRFVVLVKTYVGKTCKSLFLTVKGHHSDLICKWTQPPSVFEKVLFQLRISFSQSVDPHQEKYLNFYYHQRRCTC